jgi:hypothetical protein
VVIKPFTLEQLCEAIQERLIAAGDLRHWAAVAHDREAARDEDDQFVADNGSVSAECDRSSLNVGQREAAAERSVLFREVNRVLLTARQGAGPARRPGSGCQLPTCS